MVVRRRSRTSQVENLIDLKIDRKCYIVANEFEARVVVEVVDVLLCAGEKVIDAKNLMPLIQKAIDKS